MIFCNILLSLPGTPEENQFEFLTRVRKNYSFKGYFLKKKLRHFKKLKKYKDITKYIENSPNCTGNAVQFRKCIGIFWK